MTKKVINHKEFHEIICNILDPHPLKWLGTFTETGWFIYQQEYWNYEQNRILYRQKENQ